jgi:hypothetical protein
MEVRDESVIASMNYFNPRQSGAFARAESQVLPSEVGELVEHTIADSQADRKA